MKKTLLRMAVLAIYSVLLSTNVSANTSLVDVTDKIANPSFEDDLNGWTVQDGVFTGGATMTPLIVSGKGKSGSKSVNFNLSYGPQFTTECRVYQTITGLEPGQYKLVAHKCYGRWEAKNGLFVNGGLGEFKTNGTSSSTSLFIEHSLVFTVNASGTATIGGYASMRREAENRADNFWIDDFKLYQIQVTPGGANTTRYMEKLDRGLVAVKVSSGVYLSWRSLGTDDPLTYFKVYRDSELIKAGTTTDATNYSDASGTASSQYKVEAYVGDELKDVSAVVTPWANLYKTLTMSRPTASGITYTPNDCSVGDLDGDGEYEIVVKWDPSNAKDNSQTGVTGNVFLDAYKMNGTQLWRIDLGPNIRAGAHYTQFLVYDFDGDGKAEVACKTAPGTKDGRGNYVKDGADNTDIYRNSDGYILTGNEYLTVFKGTTGENLATVNYEPARGTVADWGDTNGNRVDRFLACVAYLDGVRPSLVMCRGYYARAALTAYDFRDGSLTKRWAYDTNTKADVQELFGQGNHNLSVADVDGDGKDEIIYGASAIDDDGTVMYRTNLGHGDAMHLSDLDPDRPGLEVWEVHEDDIAFDHGYELHDAETGAIIWSGSVTADNGRGMAADITANHRGFEMWSSAGSGTYNVKGTKISNSKPSQNFRIYWDGDLQDELMDGSSGNALSITKWNAAVTSSSTLITFTGTSSVNTTKANPCLSADILGDWREEVIVYNKSTPAELRIYTTTTPTTYRLYTLMHDPVYRMGIAWQNTAYNQPPHLGFYIGDGLGNVPTPNIITVPYLEDTATAIESGASKPDKTLSAYLDADGVLRIESPEASIQAVSIYSIGGGLLHQSANLNSNGYSYYAAIPDKALIVKVTTTEGVKSLKVIGK
ncbi:rhamnogalacturonan lyase [Viscerimonas tarda]